MNLILALVVLAITLTSAIVRSRRLAEWLAAASGSILLLAVGAVTPHAAGSAVSDLASTVAFLAALLVLSEGCRRQRVFETLGSYMGFSAAGRPQRLFALVFGASTVVTVVLGLDPTVVLLTPIALITAARLNADPKPGAYACAHLANSASLLLPVSNLTNLLAFHASHLSFTRFAAIMALPWGVAVAVEWLVLRRFFASELRTRDEPLAPPAQIDVRIPRETGYALGILALTLVGFLVSSPLGIAPVWIAVGGAALVTLPSAGRNRLSSGQELVRSVQPGFLVFVFGLGVIVRAAADNGLRSAVVSLLPSGGTLPDLILVAVVATVAANLLNNLPATLILAPVAGALGLGPLLAVLVGVNIGPNLTYGGSLATLLWRRIVHPQPVLVELGEFTRLGLVTVLPALPLTAAAVWLSVKLVG
ncbi:MAG TPA: SLC13 family permease [Solirubrobacteraceae bacterium]|nr:SLC13 family permease [Solirubrobacteraceae bacterium]